MMPVSLPFLPTEDAMAQDWAGRRPSIETSMHAALSQAVVVHIHSVDAIALAVRNDVEVVLAERLAGLRWAFVPYRRPGLPLTRAIAEADPAAAADVLVLGNHGLVVAADDVATAEALLADVVARLSSPARVAAAEPEALAAMIDGQGYRLPADPETHSLATDPISLAIAERGVLYPDHVVFLGAAPLVIDGGGDLAAALEQCEAAGRPRPRWVIVRGLGVALADDIARGGEEMARCLADVAARIPAGAALSFLTQEDVAALTDWDAERYRQQLAMAPV